MPNTAYKKLLHSPSVEKFITFIKKQNSMKNRVSENATFHIQNRCV